MPKIEEGKRFTDLAYASKDEVKAIYNKDDISKEWGKVLSYRSFFTTDTELRDEEENAYFLVLSPSVLKACYQLEERLFQDLLLFLSLSEEGKRVFRLKRKKHALMALSRHALEKIPSDSTIERIAANEIENVPTSLFLLGEYSQAYDESLPSTDEGLFALNNRIQGEKEDSAPLMRKDRKEDVINTLTLPAVEKVTPHLTSYFLFLQQKDIPLLARAVLSLYFFLSVRPMEYVNEETAALFAKNLLRNAGLSDVGFALDFESVAFSRSAHFYHRMKETEKTLDLTYVLAYILPFLSKDEEGIRNLLSEEKKADGERKEKTLSPETPAAEGFEVELALPAFQPGVERKVVEERTKKLLEVYPFLKKKEAHFYAGHCQVGCFYTIENFMKEELTVYETARSSMEDLAKKGFYRKELQGKKFIYTPVPMKAEFDEEK